MGGDRAGLGPEEEPARPGAGVDGGLVAGGDGTGGNVAGSRRRWPWVLLVLLGFVVGAGAGWVVRDVADPADARPPAPPVAAAPMPAPAPGVPCPAAADAGAAIGTQLDRAVDAFRDFDPRALQGVLDELQRQQARLEAAVASCRAVVAPP